MPGGDSSRAFAESEEALYESARRRYADAMAHPPPPAHIYSESERAAFAASIGARALTDAQREATRPRDKVRASCVAVRERTCPRCGRRTVPGKTRIFLVKMAATSPNQWICCPRAQAPARGGT